MKITVSLIAALLVGCSLFAGPGDTLEIKSHEDVVIKTNPSVGHTEYPEWVEFPDVNTDVYKLYAYLTFECAPGLSCGEWDYINYIKVGRAGGTGGQNLNWEIARFITPYGFYWNSGSNWKHGWYYDLTDFSGVLRDSIEIIYRHTGYEANNDRGWKINLTFFAIEGQPYEEIVDITPMWSGSFQYGNPANPIEDHLDQQTVTLDAQTQAASLKIIQTGHGFNNLDNCAEFCPKVRTVKKDGASINQRLIWRDCGFNSLFPQAGTWLYDRGNWCPGASVIPDDVDLGIVSGGGSYDLDVDMEPYTDNGNYGNYAFTSYLLEYRDPSYKEDVSLESVIAPSREYEHLRFNPICGTPMLEVRNNGENLLTSLTVEYGVPGKPAHTYNWTGSLDYKAKDTIYITQPMNWDGFSGQLYFELKDPNGKPDEFPHNNRQVLDVEAPTTIPGGGIILFYRTNLAASENSYVIRDMEYGNIAFSKTGLANSTNYRDTIPLTPGHCYQLEFKDDGPTPGGLPQLNEDGLSWWANTADGTGFLRVLSGGGSTVRQFNPDFGEKVLFQFRVDYEVGLERVAGSEPYFEVSPNPSTGILNIHYDLSSLPERIEILDIQGRSIRQLTNLNNTGITTIDLSNESKGVYLVKLSTQSDQVIRKIVLQ